MDSAFCTELRNRRDKICASLRSAGGGEKGDTLLLFSAGSSIRNGDVEHSYRQDSDFYYLTGFEEPDSVLLLSAEPPHMTLFVRERDKERETWDGRRAGTRGAVETFGADEAHPISELKERLADYLEDRTRLHYLFGQEEEWDKLVLSAVGAVRKRRRKRVDAPSELVDARALLHEARVIKTSYEQKKMAEVGELSAQAHCLAMESCRPGLNEWELQTTIESSFRRSGARRLAYDSIVGSGVNGTILHYQENRRTMQSGDLVLIDAGAELDYLAADITRTFPVNGKFTPIQRRLYEIVLDAQLLAIAQVRVGKTLDDIHQTACRRLQQGLKDEGLFEGIDEQDEEAVKKRIKHFYMHQTSHYLGMDVHDVGAYHSGGELKKLELGMVVTVEPGLYIAEDDLSVPEEYRGIGIRIEDDIVVTTGEPRNLSASAPKTVEEVETACANHGRFNDGSRASAK